MAWSCVVMLLCAVPLAAAQSALPGPSSSGLRGLPNAGAPIGQREITLRATLGYGLTESRRLVPSATHRLAGGLAASVSPFDWLGFGLRLDGRLELHGDDGNGSHTSGFGDPRLFARAGYALDPEWSIGGELLAWSPGSEAPSFVAAATSVDARVLGAYQPKALPFQLFASVGARLDNSSEIAPVRSRMRPSDIQTLGVSDSHAILGALGALYIVDPAVQVFGELSGDILVGSKAPTFTDSPLRAIGGGRWQFAENFQAEGSAVISLSTRPSLGPNAAWVPIEPRVLILFGVSYTWSPFTAPPPAPTEPDNKTAIKQPEEKPQPKLASVQGVIVDEQGQPVPDVRVTLTAADGTHQEAITDGDGKYKFEKVPYGTAQLEAHAVGFTKQQWEADISQPTIESKAPAALAPRLDVGVLRGLVRSFDSTPLVGHVSVRDTRGKLVQERDCSADGRFELELPPGQYKVSIEAPGFRNHTQTMRIKGNGVSVLNADMRAQ
jgi:hypothetical protein